MSTTTDTIHIDSFQVSLHGRKILCQGPFRSGAYPPLLEHMTDLRIPFQRRVLLTNGTHASTASSQYDAQIRIRDTSDWSLALTYILHAPKDVLVIAMDLPIPDAVWPKLPKTVTLVHMVTAPLRSVTPYDVLFFAPVVDTAGDHILKVLQPIHKRPLQLKDIFQELRVAGAGLAWTREEGGSLYWYDPVSEKEALGSEPLSNRQLSELFLTLSHQFS